jgi:dCMP deaminase
MPNSAAKKIIVVYLPVIHRGYLDFFAAFAHHRQLLIIGDDLLKNVDYLRKDLRALSPKQAAQLIAKAELFDRVGTLTESAIKDIDQSEVTIVMPDEDVSREVAKRLKRAKVTFYPVFLRWDRHNVDAPELANTVAVSRSKKDKAMMTKAVAAADSSSDIWRHVGAVLLDKDGAQVGVASNQGEPSEHSPWMEGDPRNIYKRGVAIETSVFSHAEAILIAEAAKQGTALKGGTMYVTTFPCPVCAKLIARSGIKHLFYKDGYAVLDGRKVLEAYEVAINRVELDEAEDNPSNAGRLVPYNRD